MAATGPDEGTTTPDLKGAIVLLVLFAFHWGAMCGGSRTVAAATLS